MGAPRRLYGVGMPERKRTSKSASSAQSDGPSGSAATGSEAGRKLASEIDDLLDEIDDVLESNAEEFVKNYVQKGGE